MRLSLPNVKHEKFGKRTFLVTETKNFNNVPLTIVKSENIQTFCRRVRHFFYRNFNNLLIFLGLNAIFIVFLGFLVVLNSIIVFLLDF